MILADVFKIIELNRLAFVADSSTLIRQSWRNLKRGTVTERVLPTKSIAQCCIEAIRGRLKNSNIRVKRRVSEE